MQLVKYKVFDITQMISVPALKQVEIFWHVLLTKTKEDSTLKPICLFAGILAAAILVSTAVVAQVQPFAPQSDMRTQLTGGGWQQLGNMDELLSFALDIAVTLLLAFLIAFHPVRRHTRRSFDDLAIPHLFLLYALVGMAVGFLVIQHGYIIGFVIFGIGGLLRFRSTLDNSADTVEVILVTVLGLAVGLGVPVLAILLGAVAWLVIWVAGRKRRCELVLRSTETELTGLAMSAVETFAAAHGWTVCSKRRIPSKFACEIVLTVPSPTSQDEIEDAVGEVLPEGVEIKIRL